MQTDHIQSRIDNLTAGLTPAVQSGQGAQFSLLLSLIAVNQQQYTPARPAPESAGDFQLPPLAYPDPNGFYSDALTERLNRSVHEQQRGEFALICSYLDSACRTPYRAQRARDQFEQVALMSGGRMLLNQIEASQLQLSA
ncbi:MAG: hypothetical protein HWE39_23860 [Oceanospirillaceae bacterium]|nr:hypothetical protein [Oceanospirillaceae bacterium]